MLNFHVIYILRGSPGILHDHSQGSIAPIAVMCMPVTINFANKVEINFKFSLHICKVAGTIFHVFCHLV